MSDAVWVLSCGDAFGHHAHGPYRTAEAGMAMWTAGNWTQRNESEWVNDRRDFDFMTLKRHAILDGKHSPDVGTLT